MTEEVVRSYLDELSAIDRKNEEVYLKKKETEKAQAQVSKSEFSFSKTEDRDLMEKNWSAFNEEHFLRIAEEFEALMQKIRLKNPQEFFMKFIR